MKKILPLIAIIICSCKPSDQEILTEHNWTIDRIINVETEEPAPHGLGQGSTFDFKTDGSFAMNRRTADGEWTHEGTWELDKTNLTLKENEESFDLTIERLNASELIFTSDQPDQIKFTLTPSN